MGAGALALALFGAGHVTTAAPEPATAAPPTTSSDTDDTEVSDETTAPSGTADVEEMAAEAESLGLEFMTSHDEVVACAEEEGSVVIQTSSDEFQPFQEGFEAAYPFLDSEFVVLSGAATERFLLEVEADSAGRYDVGYPAPEAYNEIADMMAWDIWGMANAGVLDIPLGAIDEERRTVVAGGSSGVALAYNSDLVSEDELPTSWEELADPQWGELGMSMDVDLNNVSVLTVHPDWGTDRVLELAAQMSEHDPVFTDGHTAAALLVQSGEVAISPFINLHSLMREVDKDPEGPLQVAFIEPVPVRQSEASGVFNSDLAEAPCAALLYIEWLVGDEAQEILDADPLQAALSWEGSRMAEMIGDRDTAIAEPADIALLPERIAQIQEAFGFPTVSG